MSRGEPGIIFEKRDIEHAPRKRTVFKTAQLLQQAIKVGRNSSQSK